MQIAFSSEAEEEIHEIIQVTTKHRAYRTRLSPTLLVRAIIPVSQCLSLAVKVPHPGKSLNPRQIGMVDHHTHGLTPQGREQCAVTGTVMKAVLGST